MVIPVRVIGRSKIGKVTPKPNITYPLIRLPQSCEDAIGQTVGIYETEHEGKRAFLLVPYDDATSEPKVERPNSKSSID